MRKFNGWALVVLGTFLILLQFALVYMAKPEKRSAQDTPVVQDRKVNFLPSALGGLFLVAGAVVILKSKADPAAEEVHPQ
jgi:hypothetical protein